MLNNGFHTTTLFLIKHMLYTTIIKKIKNLKKDVGITIKSKETRITK